MDCLQSREVISEAFDRGVDETALAAEARRHCRGCAECRTFVEGLALLRKTPGASAPPELVEAIVERGRKMAEAGLVKPVAPPVLEDVSAEAPSDEPDPQGTDWGPRPVAPRREERDVYWWGTRIAAGVAAVVLAAFAVSLSMQGFRAMRPGSRAGSAGPAATSLSAPAKAPDAIYKPNYTSPNFSTGAQAEKGYSKDRDAALLRADAGGARYVDFGSVAYAWLGARKPDLASLTLIGSLTSSLDTSASASYDVWQSKTDPDVIFIRTTPATETYVAFRKVVRNLGGKRYALAASGLGSYGVWPALPSNLTTPTAPDGSPTFVAAGKDDTGLSVYTPAGASATDGFAIAPNTSPNDPAGGSPNWTWWIPRP